MKALVVGAGPAGLAAALQLVSWCDDIMVIDARPRATAIRAGEHLPPNALAPLSSLGLNELLDDPNHTQSSGVCSVWGNNTIAERDYFFSPAGHGINLRREVFDEALIQRCEQSGARLYFDMRLADLEQTPDGYRAAIRGPNGTIDIHSDIVLDASGRNARAARLLGATFNREDNLIGIVGRVKCSTPTEDAGRLHIQSVQDGWWYTVQFSDGLLIATYMTDAIAVKQHKQGALGLWRKQLSKSGSIARFVNANKWPNILPKKVSVFDASTQLLGTMTSDTFLAIGDAAVAFDPLSSWGITKGMIDGFEGAKALQCQQNGDKRATYNHRSKQYQDFLNYRENRNHIYSAEQRWPDSSFWRTRQTSIDLH